MTTQPRDQGPEGPIPDSADVVVLGSGGAGLAAAIAAADRGASVLLLEKAELLGGTTAVSGGNVWMPNNHHQPEGGVEDSVEDARTYLFSLSHGEMEPRLVDAFLTHGPGAIATLEEGTGLRFRLFEGYPDYHPTNPGAMPDGGRTLDPDTFPFDELGEWGDLVRVGRHHVEGLLRMTIIEGFRYGRAGLPAEELAERRARDVRARGNGLVGPLLKGCLDRGVQIRTNTRAVRLLGGDAGVRGVVVERGGERIEVAASAVVLATGGFERSESLARTFLRGPLMGPLGAPGNEGDGLRMAMEQGSALGVMADAWWMPTIPSGGPDSEHAMCLVERTLPRSIIVNRHGKRFINEASNYNHLGRAMFGFDPVEFAHTNIPAWLVFDQEYLDSYGFNPAFPWVRVDPESLLTSASTLTELAEKLGIDPRGLVETVERFNGFVARGDDEDFARGRTTFDRFNGDRTREGALATLGPIERAPFHAVPIVPGALGTKGGPRTDEDGRVLSFEGEPIRGLYAAGNAMASATGAVYGGAGGTLGPALTFGHLAGRAAAADR